MPVVPIVATTAQASSGSSELGPQPELVVDRHLAQLEPEQPRRLVADRVRVLRADEDVAVGMQRPRATTTAASTPVEAVSSMWPVNPSGRPTSCRNQSSVSSSSSCSAGDVRQRIPTWLSPAMSSSASTPGSAAGRREVGEEARALPVGEPGQEHASRSSGRPRTARAPRAATREAPRGSRPARPARAPGARAHARGRTRPTRARAPRRRGSRLTSLQLRERRARSACSGPAPS